ncbi:MAG: helix-turn-helix domain-containing protein [Halobacterium sp.]
MKSARIRATPDADLTPQLFDALARSAAVEEARLHDWNLAPGDARDGAVATMLFEVDGDRDRFVDELAGARGLRSVDATPVDAGRFEALLVVEPGAVPMMADVFGSLTRAGLVVGTPVVYREGSVRARIVGASRALQRAVDAFPDGVAVDVEAVGEFRRHREQPTAALTDRQREALLAASDLGYYEVPREATNEDVADRLGCAPNTASEHLQKAEAKLVAAALSLEEG